MGWFVNTGWYTVQYMIGNGASLRLSMSINTNSTLT